VSELPLGWERCALGDLARYVTSGSRDWSKYYSTNGALFVRTENINRNRLGSLSDIARVVLPDSVEGKRTRIQRDDLLITITGANVGKCAHIDIDLPEAYVSQSVALVRLFDCIISRFIHRQLIAPGPAGDRTLLQQSAYGLGRPVLNLDNVRQVPIALAPLREQRRIADKLDVIFARVDACRERLDQVPAILKRFRQAVLAAATSGKMTEKWREANPGKSDAAELAERVHSNHVAAGGHKIGNAALPTEDVHDLSPDMFPIGWGLLTLRDLVLPDRPITYGILKPGPELEMGVPYVRVADFPGEKLNLALIRRTSPTIDEKFKRSRLRPGDLLLSIRGTVGRLIVIPDELQNANITQDSARLSIQPSVNRDYVLWYLRSELAQSRMKRSIKGVAVRGINIGDVRALQVPLPSRAEQDEIVRRVDALLAYADNLESHYTAALDHVERLAPALLSKAFRGKLLPQDSNDAPAFELLEQIRAERAEQLAQKGERKPTLKLSNRTSKEKTVMAKSRFDVDVKDKPYLASLLREVGGNTKVEDLFKRASLPVVDFYKQLAWEVEKGHVIDNKTSLKVL
jgi:type I restriction enzyme, S subunit